MYDYHMQEAQEWYDAASGYSRDDERRRECLDKYFQERRKAERYNTDVYFGLMESAETEYNNWNKIERFLDQGYYDEKDYRKLVEEYHESYRTWEKICKELKEYLDMNE